MTKSEGELTWRGLEIGSIITEPGNASQYQTGGWRTQRPIHDTSRCIKCGLCAIFCPEGCIEPNAEGYFEPNLFYCKGCGICARECWTQAITMVEEEE
ncbi:Pyruvate synthase subunit PorD [subsurface metagenome]